MNWRCRVVNAALAKYVAFYAAFVLQLTKRRELTARIQAPKTSDISKLLELMDGTNVHLIPCIGKNINKCHAIKTKFSFSMTS